MKKNQSHFFFFKFSPSTVFYLWLRTFYRLEVIRCFILSTVNVGCGCTPRRFFISMLNDTIESKKTASKATVAGREGHCVHNGHFCATNCCDDKKQLLIAAILIMTTSYLREATGRFLLQQMTHDDHIWVGQPRNEVWYETIKRKFKINICHNSVTSCVNSHAQWVDYSFLFSSLNRFLNMNGPRLQSWKTFNTVDIKFSYTGTRHWHPV